MSRRPLQLSLPCRGRGGFRPGAGRPRGTRVSHHGRESIARPAPLHVVWRTRKDVRNLRGKALFRQIKESLRRCHLKRGFQITHFSVLGNHVHALVEADQAALLSRGMQGLGVSMAKRINRTSARRGAVFEDRFFSRELRTPSEVANAIDYVLRNHERHLARQGAEAIHPVDPCSSAAVHHGPPLVAPPRTWLLRIGWRRTRHRDSARAPADQRTTNA